MSLILLLSFFFHLNSPINIPVTGEVNPPTDVTLTYQFGDSIQVDATLQEIGSIDRAIIIFQTDSGAKMQVPVSITPDGKLSGRLDLSDNPFKVFDHIYYWFELTDKAGNVTKSPSYWFDYLDNRFAWHKSESKWFTIYKTEATTISDSDLQEIALAGLKRATDLIPVSPQLPMQIYIYPDVDSLSSALGITSQDWVAGETRPDLGVIMVSAASADTLRVDLERQIPHEIVHLLEYSLTKTDYTDAPKWLLEGLAVNGQDDYAATFDQELSSAYQKNTLIPFEQLCTSFPPESSQSTLAYAQSASFVSYLLATYGDNKLTEMLQSVGTGGSCDQLVSQTLGKDLATLQAEWINAAFPKNHVKKGNPNDYWLLLLILPVVFAGLWCIRRHGSAKKKSEPNNEK
jgi:hypothetical protein